MSYKCENVNVIIKRRKALQMLIKNGGKAMNKKKLLSAVMACAMTVSLAACGNSGNASGDSSGNASGTAAGEKTTITVWTKNRHDLEYMTAVVEEFNAANDHIYIDYVVQSDNFDNLVQMAISSGDAPDVISNGDTPGEFAKNGLIIPLNEYLENDEEYVKVNDPYSHMYEGLNSLGDQIYWVPCGKRSGSRLIANQDILDKNNLTAPTTLEELVEVCATISENGGGVEYGMVVPGASSPFERWIERSAEMSGVTPYDYVNGKFDFTGYAPILEYVREIFETNGMLPGTSSMKVDPSRVQFSEGVVGFMGNASQEATVLTEQFPAKCNWSVYQLPTLTGEIVGALSCTPNNGYQITSTCENPDLAWEVISYFGSEEVLKGYLESGYTLPMSEYMDSVVDKSKIGRMADFAGATYEAVYPQYPSVTPEGQVYRDALWNACLPDGPSIDETIAALNESYNEALDSAIEMSKETRLVIKDFDPMNPSAGTAEYLSE